MSAYPPPPVPSQAPPPPPAGHRYALSSTTPFPDVNSLPPTSFHDLGGSHQRVYVGSAIMGSSVHPCKIASHFNPPARVSYGGQELGHVGRYDLLPVDDRTMEWVQTSHGRIPPGRRPIEGGYEEGGQRLYHALTQMHGVWVPGKTGEHLVSPIFFFGPVRVFLKVF